MSDAWTFKRVKDTSLPTTGEDIFEAVLNIEDKEEKLIAFENILEEIRSGKLFIGTEAWESLLGDEDLLNYIEDVKRVQESEGTSE